MSVFWLVCAALAFPDVDPEREEAVFGESLPLAMERGAWHHDESGLVLSAPVAHGDNYWLSERHRIDDGLVRARFRAGSHLDTGLIIRATVGEDPEAISGYGLTLNRDTVFFQRWDGGVSLGMHTPVKVPRITEGRHLEVVVYLVGPQLAAFVYDAETLQEVASITIRDTTYVEGAIGVRGSLRHPGDHTTFLSSMSVPPIVLDAEAEVGPFGPERLVRISTSDRALVPADLMSCIRAEDDEELVLVTDPIQLEQLKRAGLVPTSVTGHVPFRYLHPHFPIPYPDGSPPPTATGFDLDSYKDPTMVGQVLAAYADRFPELARVEEIGRTHLDQPILALKISDNVQEDEDEPSLLINGAHHGSELLSTEYALDVVQTLLEQYTTDERVRGWVDASETWVVPLVNPDGAHVFVDITRWAGRKNGRDTNDNGVLDPWDGVDLNRNYPYRFNTLGERGSRSFEAHYRYRGPTAASEPEVRAMIELANREHFLGAISFHTLATLVLSPYTIDGAENPTPDLPWAIAETMVAAAGPQPNRKHYRVRRKIYAVDGVDQDWHYHTHGTFAYVVEGSHHNPKNDATRRASIVGVRPVWKTFFDEILGRPRVWGHVRDKQGHAIPAEISVDGITTREGEQWTARPRDGRFERIVPHEGTWRITASHPGYEPVTSTVRVGGRNRPVEFVLEMTP